VPGVIAYSYLTRPIVERWGREWLEGGTVSVRFLKPVYDGDDLAAALSEDGEGSLRNAADELCVAGQAAPTGKAESPEAAGEPLRPIVAELSEAAALTHLELVGETLPLYRRERLGHPGWLLSLANDILIENIRPATPWIHVESVVRNFAAADWGQEVKVGGSVTARYERRGHRFCDLDLLMEAQGRPLARVMHRAIYELRPPGS